MCEGGGRGVVALSPPPRLPPLSSFQLRRRKDHVIRFIERDFPRTDKEERGGKGKETGRQTEKAVMGTRRSHRPFDSSYTSFCTE